MDLAEEAIYRKSRSQTEGLAMFELPKPETCIVPLNAKPAKTVYEYPPDSVAGNSQEGKVLKHLQSGATLTPLEALNLFGSLRLAALIWCLRNKGYHIQSRTITLANGKRVAEYTLLDK